MSTFSFKCPGCAQQYHIPHEAAGRRSRCKKCGTRFTLPELAKLDEPSVEPSKVDEPPPRPQPQPKRPAPLTEWWHSRTPTQKVAGLGFLLALFVLASYTVFEDTEPKPQPRQARPLPIAPARPVSKLTRENYMAIREGMPEDEVILILGKPTERWAWPEKLSRGNVSLFFREGDKEVRVHLETKGDVTFNRPKVESKSSKGLD